MSFSCQTIRILAAAALLSLLTPSLAHSEEGTRWQLSWFDTLTNKTDSTVFSSREDAVAHQRAYEKVQNLKKGGPAYTNWKLTPLGKSRPASASQAGGAGGTDLLSRLQAAKTAVDAAKRTGKGALRDKELFLGEVIDEYKDSVARSYQKIRDLQKTLLGGTQEIQDQRFRDINRLVERYNRQLSDFSFVMGASAPLPYRQLPEFQPSATKADKPAATEGETRMSADRYYVHAEVFGIKSAFGKEFKTLDEARGAGEAWQQANDAGFNASFHVSTDPDGKKIVYRSGVR